MADIKKLISQYREDNKSQEEIFGLLLKQGFKVDEIYTNLKEISQKSVTAEDHQKKTIHIIVTIGALLIGASAFSFVASNWQEIPRFVKVVILLIAMSGAYGAGWYMKIKSDFEKTGQSLILVGALIYGASIFLVGQMYHLPVNWPDGFILWMVGVLFMQLVSPSWALMVLAALLGVIAVISNPLVLVKNIIGFNTTTFTSQIVLLLGVVISFVYGYILHKRVRTQVKKYY